MQSERAREAKQKQTTSHRSQREIRYKQIQEAPVTSSPLRMALVLQRKAKRGKKEQKQKVEHGVRATDLFDPKGVLYASVNKADLEMAPPGRVVILACCTSHHHRPKRREAEFKSTTGHR